MPPVSARRPIPDATVARLPIYHRSLSQLREKGTSKVSSAQLANMAGLNAAKVRKDLSYLGSYGTRGVGYEVKYLLFQIDRELGLAKDLGVAILGLGNLGRALANYGGFGDSGFPVAALLDNDQTKVGTTYNGVKISHLNDLAGVVVAERIAIAIIATPAHVAQEVTDQIVAAGVTSILNFAPTTVTVPDHVTLRKVDLASELQILGFYQHRDTDIAEAS
ncbi:MAG: redox-sensing transcriptional repressor Rex [Acidimicrobiales bacterium]|jgi:redox-sensing transcriptional repressor